MNGYQGVKARLPRGVVTIILLLVAAGVSSWSHILAKSSEIGERPLTLPWWALALGFAFAEVFAVEVRFRGEGFKLSLSEAVLVAALFFAEGPGQILLAGSLAPAIFFSARAARGKLSPIKAAFNISLLPCQIAIAWWTFSTLNPSWNTEGPSSLSSAFVAAACASLFSYVAVATVVCVATGKWSASQFTKAQALAGINVLTGASLGLVASNLILASPILLVFLVGPMVLMYVFHGNLSRGLAAETRARESQELLEAIVDNSPAVIYVKDMQGRYLLVNKGWERLTGKKRTEAMGRSTREVLPERLAADFVRTDPDAYKSQQPLSLEETATLEDGEHTYVSVKFPLKDESGDMFAMGGISTDITASKQLEQAARENAALLSSAFQAAHAGMALILPNGRYLEVNESFCQMLGYTREQLLEMDWMTLTYPPDLVENEPIARDMLSGITECHVYEKRFVHKDGRLVICELSDAVVRDDAGEPVYFVTHIHDVTAQRESEARMRQSQKMEAVGQLAGGIAHDFNNLLSVMLNYAMFASESLKPGDSAKEDLDEVVGAARRAADLTRQLLAFSRQEPKSPRNVDLNEAVTSLHQMLKRSLPENIQIDLALAPGVEPVHMDPSQLEQIVMNLVVNARDAMPDGGDLRISTQTMDIDQEWANAYHGLPAGRFTRLQVTDTGEGMSPKTIERVFEPFFTTKDMGNGTGLGLATVYGIVKGADGYIYVSSDVGVGTVVSVYLPPSTAAVTVLRPEEPTLEWRPAAAHSVLVVEDEPAVRRLAHRMLRDAGFQVVTASSGGEALTLIAEGAAVDLVLCDVVMPGMSGKRFAEKLREQQPDIPLLYMSGYTDDLVAVKGVIADDEHLLQKPFTSQQLVAAVCQVLGQSSFVPAV